MVVAKDRLERLPLAYGRQLAPLINARSAHHRQNIPLVLRLTVDEDKPSERVNGSK